MGVSRALLLVLAAVLGLALAGCGSGSSSKSASKPRYVYPTSVKKQFLDACEVHTQSSVCECVMHAYENTIPPSVYHDIARGGVRLNNQQYFRAFTDASIHCSK